MLYIIVGPSGAGKTTIVENFLKHTKLPIKLVVSHTSREPREGEVDGVDYHFLSREDFCAKIEAGEFLEHAVVFGNYYGTSRAAVTEGDCLLIIDWQGAEIIRRKMTTVTQIGIIAPNLQALEMRLQRRGTDSKETIDSRMGLAERESQKAMLSDYVIVNHSISGSTWQLEEVIQHVRKGYVPV